MESLKDSSVITCIKNDLNMLTIAIEDGFKVVNKMQDTIKLSSTNVAQQNIIVNEDILSNEDKEHEENETSDDDGELTVDQQYWQWCEFIDKKSSCSKPKFESRQRTTQRELAYQKSIVRSPYYYKFDKLTNLILKRLRDKNIFGDYHNIVGYGKNSIVIHAHCSPLNTYLEMGVAVKVYKLTNDSKHDNAILKRVQREHKHLLMLQNQNKAWYVPCVYHKYRNVIVTDFVGFDEETAPSITSVPDEHAEELYKILVNELYKLYNDVHLVHGRLSTKNILYLHHTKCPKYIGWAHSVKREHPMALKKLIRDCHFITQFFKKKGVPVRTTEELFKDVTGLDHISAKVLAHLDVIYDLWPELHQSNPNKSHLSDLKHSRNNRFK